MWLTKIRKCAALWLEDKTALDQRRHTMTNSEKIKQILLSEIEKMNQHREDFCRHPGTDFTRDRKISFDTLLHFQISMESGSVNHELLKYFNFDAGTPSLSAFYQQRAKLSDDEMYLVPLYDLLNEVYTDAVIQPIRKRNEFAALYGRSDRHTPCNGTVPIFIADRGFHAYNVFAHSNTR